MTLPASLFLPREAFQHCMVYVALSRVRDVQHLYLQSPIMPNQLHARDASFQNLLAHDDRLRAAGAATMTRLAASGVLSAERTALAYGVPGVNTQGMSIPFYGEDMTDACASVQPPVPVPLQLDTCV